MAATNKNVKINLDKESFTLSSAPSSFEQWKKQKNRHYTTSKYYRPLHKFLLGLYAFSQFLFYPALVVAAVLYDWKISLAIFGGFVILQAIIYGKTMKQFGEKDLFPFFLLLDVWMFFYYIIFAPSLLMKPKASWK